MEINKSYYSEPNKPITKKLKELPVTYYLVAINVLVFLMLHTTNFLVEQNWFIAHFAKITNAISVDKEYYRFFTAIFVHEELTHLTFNCIALLLLGKPIELIFGKFKFLLIFIVSGLFGTLFSFIFSPYTAIGASGGIFGIFGVHIYLLIKNKDLYFKVFGKDVIILLGINVIVGFILPNIDFWGHFGGIFGGFLCATMLGLSQKVVFKKGVFVGLFLIITIFVSSFMYFNHNYIEYVTLVDELVDQANLALNENDVNTLITISNQLKSEQPKLPPIIGIEAITDQIDMYIEKMK